MRCESPWSCTRAHPFSGLPTSFGVLEQRDRTSELDPEAKAVRSGVDLPDHDIGRGPCGLLREVPRRPV